jgi:predicted secreted hydrolase
MLLFIIVSSELFFICFDIFGNETIYDVESKDNDDNCKYDLKLIDGVEKVEEPKEGMTFKSLEELASHYRSYAKQQDFGVVQKN